MFVSVLSANNGSCPVWRVPVSVRGWYRLDNDGHYRFLRAECLIIENSKLPLHKQTEKYLAMFCREWRTCPLYKEFQPETTADM